MNKQILGCNIDFRSYETAEKALEKEIGDDLLLSAVSEKTGVEPSAIQNWVKRGYVENAKGKKYSREQVAQIILLNNLKNALALDEAAELLAAVKKKTGASSVDILGVLASSLIRALRFNSTDRDSLKSVINIELRNSAVNNAGLSDFILSAALSSLCGEYRRLAQREAKSL